jgi:ABC-2 type transport system permease protein
MRLFLHELRAQQRLFWRSRELAFFTFVLPLILFVLLGSVNQEDRIEGVRGSDYLLAGMIGYGAASTAFAGLGILLVVRREGGTLKRLRSTPLPAGIYLAAVLVSTLIAFAIEVAVLIALGSVLFDAHVPERVVSLGLVVLLGAGAFAALGVAAASLVRSADAAAPALNAAYLPMAFLSGSFFSREAFPDFLQRLADALPLTYFIDIVRDVVLENHELWESPGALAAVAAWGVAGLLVAVRAFSWEPRAR